jgi:hypothetical protein
LASRASSSAGTGLSTPQHWREGWINYEAIGKSVIKLIELAVSRKSVKRPHPLPNYPTEPAEEYRRRVREAINLLKKKE